MKTWIYKKNIWLVARPSCTLLKISSIVCWGNRLGNEYNIFFDNIQTYKIEDDNR